MPSKRVDLPAGAWARLTDISVDRATIQNLGSSEIYVTTTSGSTPSEVCVGLRLALGEAIGADLLLSDIFPAVQGASVVWAWSYHQGSVYVNHA